jgi:hypothetical protein
MINPHIGFSLPLIMLLGLMVLGGCGIPQEVQGLQYEQKITQSIDQYHVAKSKVKLKDSMEEVLAILMSTQAKPSGELKRGPGNWIDPNSDKAVGLYYFRSGWQSDGRLTDDEVTPYLFINNTLVAIGWNAFRSLAIQPNVRCEFQKLGQLFRCK